MQGKAICRSFPGFITLELSNICNLNCIMCPRDKMKREKGNMDFSFFKKIIDEVKDYIEVVDLDLFGEFSYNPNWDKMVAYAKSRGLFTVLNTNATLMDDEIAGRLIASGLDFLNISFDGASREVYEKVRRGAKYEETLANIKNFLSKNKNIYSVIQMIKTTETEEEVTLFRSRWEYSGVDVVRIKKYMAFDPETSHLDPEKEKKKNIKPSPCLFLWRNLVICQDGIVVPCCVDYDEIYKLGDAKKQKILDIWNGKPMQKLREMHTAGKYRDVKLCSQCNPLTAHPFVILLESFIDDAMRRKLMPYVEDLIE